LAIGEIKPSKFCRCPTNGNDFGVCGRIVRAENFIMSNGNYLAILDNNRSERSSLTGFRSLSGGFDGYFHVVAH
jgi:hypothetical protein